MSAAPGGRLVTITRVAFPDNDTDFRYSELSLHVYLVQAGTDPLLWKNFPLRLEAGPRLNSFFGIARLVVVKTAFLHFIKWISMMTCFRLTGVTRVTIALQHVDPEAFGFLPDHLYVQEQQGVDISSFRNSPSRGWKRDAHLATQICLVEAVTTRLPNLESLIIDLDGSMASFSPWLSDAMVSDYLTSKIGGHLRHICARVCRENSLLQYSSPQFTFHYWSCLDDTAVDFLKTTTNGALVLDVDIRSAPGGQLPSAVFDVMSRGCKFTTNLSLEGLVLEKCAELGIRVYSDSD